MSNSDSPKYKDELERLERETRLRGFVEYPKMLHHPDGRGLEVANKREEEAALSGDWCPTPDAALKEKARRDQAEKAAEAAAKRKEPKP